MYQDNVKIYHFKYNSKGNFKTTQLEKHCLYSAPACFNIIFSQRILPGVISRHLPLINSLKLPELGDVVEEGEDDHHGHVPEPLAHRALVVRDKILSWGIEYSPSSCGMAYRY